MPRKLKSYVTSLGFFDLAIAAPSMKAALAAWGEQSNLFHQGVANQTNDPEVIAATMAPPRIILKRAVGSDGPFREHAELPKICRLTPSPQASIARKKVSRHRARSTIRPLARLRWRSQKSKGTREAERQKEEAATARKQERRQRAIARAEAALEKAKREHDKKLNGIQTERAAIDKRAEESRWKKLKEKLESALRPDTISTEISTDRAKAAEDSS
jgi:colicin import membrane protein